MEILCQFTKLENAIKIFEGSRLRLGNISKSNDPVEIKKLQARHDQNRNIIETDRLNAELNYYLDKILKVTCFTYGEYDFDHSSGIIKAEDNDERPPFFKPRMWALYGGKSCDNSGVCIVFNKNRLESQFTQLDEDYNYEYREIEYKNFLDEQILGEFNINTEIEVLNTIEESVQNYLANNYEFNYLSKDKDWIEEDERRLLCWNKLENRNYGDTFLDFDSDDVEAVILGYNISNNNQSYIDFIQCLFSKNIPVYKLGLVENVPAIKSINDAHDDELLSPVLEINHEVFNQERQRLRELEE